MPVLLACLDLYGGYFLSLTQQKEGHQSPCGFSMHICYPQVLSFAQNHLISCDLHLW